MRNEQLQVRRVAMPSPSGSGKPMSRSELAALVNEYVRARTGRPGGLRRVEVGRYERGEVRWPGKLYRQALRSILGAESDQELGFFPTPRGDSPALVESNDRLAARREDAAVASIARFGGELTARALIRSSGQILVVRPHQAGWSCLPGGRIEPGNPVQSTLVGHVAQQTGASATIIGFVGGVEQHRTQADAVDHAITLVFEARVSDSRTLDHAVNLETEWVAADDLVHHDLRPAALKEALIDGADGPFWRAWTQ